MTIKELIDSGLFKTINVGDDTDRNISGLFCCDLPVSYTHLTLPTTR